ncbi:hypothetical protein ZEAMMB73_Zm00001d043051 [Zea mays]|uniref:Uncharacterized protein n=1 Tax=Zea mays TaxID=4577 RepID=A0A1D6N857_MAIZE|nr:hypothetical protein ZEAMMB73_Zm00001d043051 [Zea mays]ONM36769.1 hypothetical protein ZEAMMB73_Zm00001d043051 [Zea mays]
MQNVVARSARKLPSLMVKPFCNSSRELFK